MSAVQTLSYAQAGALALQQAMQADAGCSSSSAPNV